VHKQVNGRRLYKITNEAIGAWNITTERKEMDILEKKNYN